MTTSSLLFGLLFSSIGLGYSLLREAMSAFPEVQTLPARNPGRRQSIM